MDQESGRRRSSRLAARGIITTPKAEIIVKKANVKSSEKPNKRSKRKTTEEIIELPEPKKSKTEDKSSSDEVEENEVDNVAKNDISGISPMDVDEPPIKEKKDLTKVEEKTAVPLEDSKDEEVVDKLPVTNEEKKEVNTSVKTEGETEKVIATVETKDEQEKVDVSIEIDEDIKKEVEIKVETDNEKPEIEEDLMKIKNPEITEQPKNDVSQDEPKQEPVALENTNGKSDENGTIEAVEEIVKNDIGFCVAATEDIKTPNGDTDEQVKSTNGDESIVETVAIEPIIVLHDDTNHVESDLKAVSATTAISTNNDAPIVEQVEKELDKSADTVVENKNVSADDNAPKVDQLSTVVS